MTGILLLLVGLISTTLVFFGIQSFTILVYLSVIFGVVNGVVGLVALALGKLKNDIN